MIIIDHLDIMKWYKNWQASGQENRFSTFSKCQVCDFALNLYFSILVPGLANLTHPKNLMSCCMHRDNDFSGGPNWQASGQESRFSTFSVRHIRDFPTHLFFGRRADSVRSCRAPCRGTCVSEKSELAKPRDTKSDFQLFQNAKSGIFRRTCLLTPVPWLGAHDAIMPRDIDIVTKKNQRPL